MKYFNTLQNFCVRRIVPLAIALVISMSALIVDTSAAELYPNSPVSWGKYSGNKLSIVWNNYNIPNTNALSAQISAGMQYWGSQSNIITTSTTSLNSANLVHVNAVEKWWNANVAEAHIEMTCAFTQIFDTAGTLINGSNVTTTTRSIGSANIYYSPYSVFNNFSAVNYKCLVAHEVGHALGFAHYYTDASIMNDGRLTYTGLQTYDISELNRKY